MITFTDSAIEKIKEGAVAVGAECAGLRVRALKVGKFTFKYHFGLLEAAEVDDSDETLELEAFKVYIDPTTMELMKGSTIDFVSDGYDAGFKVDNPQGAPSWDDPVAKKVQKVIDEKLTPGLAGHGGWIELDSIEGDTAYIRFGGGCQGCAGAQATLKQGIQTAITSEVPEISTVEDRTDHGAGDSPYQ